MEGDVYYAPKSTGTDLAINYDLVKCITKNRYSYLKYNRKAEGELSPKR